MEHIEGFDIGMWNFLQSLRPSFPFIDPIIQMLSLLDQVWLLLGLTALFTLIALRRHQPGVAIFVLAAFAGGELLAWAAQSLVERERPGGVVNWIDPPRSPWSFPSEHTLLASVTYLALAFTLADWYPQRRRTIWISADFLVFWLGWSRMFIGACFPTDVVGGWLGGIAWVLFCRWVQERTTPMPQLAVENQSLS